MRILLSAFLLSMLLINSASAQEPSISAALVIPTVPEQYKYFNVSADAEVKVQPNRLSIVFGLDQRDPNLKNGQNKMHKIIKDAIAFCRKNGVSDKNIQTNEIQVKPYYKYDSNDNQYQQNITYYGFEQSFVITLEDLSKYEEILYGVLNLGINTVHSVSLYSTDMLKYRNQARVNAINAAKAKAKLLTDEAGIKLVKIVHIDDNSSPSYGRFYYSGSNNMASNISQNISQSGDWEASETGDLSLGSIPVKASVSLVYEVSF